MAKVFHIFVEKKRGNDIEAQQTLNDLRENVGLTSLEDLRIINRYFAQGLTESEFDSAVKEILSEPNLDTVFAELDIPDDYRYFATEYLPGQYDQRADSAAQCIQLLTAGERPTVQSAKIIAVKGEITDAEFEKIKRYIINPVESREASLEIPSSLDIQADAPADIIRINGFISMTDSEISDYHKSMDFAMSADDLRWVRDYFKNDEKRDPSLTELKVIDTYWSDHCRHTTFATELSSIKTPSGKYEKAINDALKQYFDIRKEVYADREKDKTVCLMDMACIGTKVLKKRGYADNLDESDEINACSIEVPVIIDGKKEQWLVQFKNETHNHPTEIEPFGGAATCLGGAIRDPLSGRAYVYQAMRVTGCGDPTTPFEKTLDAKLPQSKITTGAAAGYSSYGNQIGLATGQVTELYDEGFVAKRMEIGAVIGASPKANVVRKCPEEGDIIVLLGGRTGRDGCGGATGSSKAHNSSSIETCGAEVQKGNPPTERKIQRLFRKAETAKMIKRCNDFGAGGVSVAIGELADGLKIDLDKVPKKYDGLDGTELAISESQERMAVVLDKENVDKFISLAYEENLEATPVAVVTSQNRLEMTWRGDKIVDISRDFLNTNGVTQRTEVEISEPNENCYINDVPSVLKNLTLPEALKANLSRLEVCSQKGLSERFDSSIGAATVLMPFAGKYQLTPEEAMVAKIPLLHGETDTATVMAYGFMPGFSRRSPFHSAAFAVSESLAKLAAVGCDPSNARLTFQEYFEKLGSDPKRWGKPTAALLGALTAQIGYKCPAIGGKDSMSGSFNDLDVPPTLVSFAVGMSEASKTVSAQFKRSNTQVKLLPLPIDESTGLPDYAKAMCLMTSVAAAIRNGKILSASVVKEGGAAACVCKMAFGNKTGFTFAQGLDKKTLFAPAEGSFVVELADENAFDGILLGKTNNNGVFIIDGEVQTADELICAWTSRLEKVFATDSGKKADMPFDVPLYKDRSIFVAKNKVAKPRVFIPAFPGTNCEIDSARAFEKAGAEVSVLIVNNLSPAAINETIEKMVKEINSSQIIMLPGGFSGGDEPEGSGKFIATTLRNPAVKEAVTKLLNCRDGLMLGICNGFQALIKLGLVPFGEIKEIGENDPTLTFNTIGRHISSMAYTRVTSVKSPWLAGVNAGDMFAVPISHGEGRFVANNDVLKKLIANGQIATQYVTPDGATVGDMPFNPNGSVCAVEGITSPDGRILGKMGHCERKGENLYSNVPFEKDMKIFESGVNYFK